MVPPIEVSLKNRALIGGSLLHYMQLAFSQRRLYHFNRGGGGVDIVFSI